MNLIVRLMRVLVAALFGRRLDFMAESRVRFRVLPTDLDINIHMTNARYFSVMDLGRVDLLVRTGLGRAMMRHGWQAMLGAGTIRYRRPLKPFQGFEVVSRVLCWDDKWVYLEQRIESGGRVIAEACVQGIFRGAQGSVPTADVLAALGQHRVSPAMPPAVAVLQACTAAG